MSDSLSLRHRAGKLKGSIDLSAKDVSVYEGDGSKKGRFGKKETAETFNKKLGRNKLAGLFRMGGAAITGQMAPPPTPYTFTLTTPARTFHFAAFGRDKMQLWVTKIKQVI